jgi:predicted DCC family thiol-disulfide oxidoreductase YuxK
MTILFDVKCAFCLGWIPACAGMTGVMENDCLGGSRLRGVEGENDYFV